MEIVEHVDGKGRKYRAFQNGELRILNGPPEKLVDELGLPEPLATNLHNILYDRGIFSFSDASKAQNQLIGALQDALRIDVQKLLEMFYRFDQGGRL